MYINQHISLDFGAKINHVLGDNHFIPDSWQLISPQQGAVQIRYQETDQTVLLQTGDVLLLEPGQGYTCSATAPCTLLGVRIGSDFLSGLLEPGQHFSCCSVGGPHRGYQQLHQLMIRICSVFYTEDNHYALLALIFELADMMKKQFVSSDTRETSTSEQLIQNRITAIRQYLHTSYHMPISLGMLADRMFLSPQYLSKFIKKHLGCTFSHYLTRIRLENAHAQLVHTEDSITAIDQNNGFPNIAAFHRAFREKYGTSPGNYRACYQESPPEPASAEIPWILEASSPQPLVLSIHTSALSDRPYEKPWCDTINIGSLEEALKISFHNNFLEYQRCIPVRYVRFTDIFSEEIVYLDQETGEFNFTTLDDILEFFYQAHVIPFVELASKPRKNHIYANTPYWDSIFHPEKTGEYYGRLLSELLTHCIRRYGRSYMSQWRFEFWLKHGTNLEYSDSFDLYFMQYQNYYRLIKGLLPECAVGGPGFNMCATLQRFTDFIREAARREIVFDFISLYGFSYETQDFTVNDLVDSQGILSPRGSHIHDLFMKYQNFLKDTGYRDQPIFLTEFGSSVALENYVVDSVFQACFLCHNMLSLIDSCSNVAYLSFWDSSADISIPSSIYYPGASLISEDGVPKPALHGYSFLARLGKRLISKGDAYILTCNSRNQFQVLFYHYTHFSDAFCTNSWEPVPMERTYEIFRPEEPLTIHFACGDFPAGRYKVVRYTLNRIYGSVLDKHLRTLENYPTTAPHLLHTLLNLKEDESRYFKQTSIPRQDIYYITSTETLTIDLTLDSHELVFYEFSRVF